MVGAKRWARPIAPRPIAPRPIAPRHIAPRHIAPRHIAHRNLPISHGVSSDAPFYGIAFAGSTLLFRSIQKIRFATGTTAPHQKSCHTGLRPARGQAPAGAHGKPGSRPSRL